MFQQILVVLLFVTAISYLGRLVYRQFQAKSSCASGCAKCSAIDFKKIEAEIAKKGLRESKIQSNL